MTQAIQLNHRATTYKSNQAVGHNNWSVGDIISGQLTGKEQDKITVEIGGKSISLSGEGYLSMAIGDIMRFEVEKVSDASIELKCLEDFEESVEKTKEKQEAQEANKEKLDPSDAKKYNDQGLNKLLKNAKEEDVKNIHQLTKKVTNEIDDLINKMTNKDIKKMMEQGLNPRKLSVEMITGIVKSNKIAPSQFDMKNIESEVTSAIEGLKNKYKLDDRLNTVVQSLTENDLPVTVKNVDKILDGLNKVDQIKDKVAHSDQWIHLLKGNGKDSLESIYKRTVSPIPPDKMLDVSASKLEHMVKEYLSDIGVDDSDETIELATRMIKQDIAITESNITLAKNPEKALGNLSEKELADKMAKKLLDSENVDRIELSFEENKVDESVQKIDSSAQEKDAEELDLRVKQLLSKISSVTNKQVIKASSKNKDVTLENIFNEDNETSSVKDAETGTDKSVNQADLIMRHRQMEEIRLKMTYEAATRLEGKGFNIETETLDQVVQALRADELSATKKMVTNSAENESFATQIETTISSVEAYKSIKNNKSETVEAIAKNELVQENQVSMASVNDAVKEAKEQAYIAEIAALKYEASGTEIRRDLGDRIDKTFDQIEPMLESLGLEITEENVNAVKILAKNEMPITEENIEQIKLIQEKVDYVTQRMNPRLILELANKGISPLDLNIDETIEVIEAFDQRYGETQTEKISRLIHDLIQNKAISSDQKDTLLGVYRTFDTVVRSKGSATGFIVKNKMQLTISNLFEAAKYIRKTGQIKPVVNANIDDQFGFLEKVNNEQKSIKELVQTAVEKSSMNDEETAATDVVARLLMDAKIRSFVSEMNNNNMVEIVKSDSNNGFEYLPLDQLKEVLMNMNESSTNNSFNNEDGNDSYDSIIKEMKGIIEAIKSNPDEAQTILKEASQMTMNAVTKGIDMNKEPFLLLDQLRSMMAEVDKDEVLNDIKEHITNISESILAGEKDSSAIKEMVHDIEKMILESNEDGFNEMTSKVTETIKTVDHLQMMQVTEDYYQIPVMMGNELSQLNMYIINNEEEATRDEQEGLSVVMSFSTKNLGQVTAYAELKGNHMALTMQSENMEDQALLRSFETKLKDLIEETNYLATSIDYNEASNQSSTIETTVETESLDNKINSNSNGRFEIVI